MGELHLWNVVSGLCGRAGLFFSCCWRPEDAQCCDSWLQNVKWHAKSGKESSQRRVIAIVDNELRPQCVFQRFELAGLDKLGLDVRLMTGDVFMQFMVATQLLTSKPSIFTASEDTS